MTLVQSYLLPSVAAAVIGGTSILGGRGGYGGTIVGALILTVLTGVLSIAPARAVAPDRLRLDRGPCRRGLHARHCRVLASAPWANSRAHRLATLAWTWAARTSSGSSSSSRRDDWKVVDQDEVPTLAARGPDAVIERLAGVGAAAIVRAPGVASAGIGVPGLYNPADGTTRLLINLPGEWMGKPMAAVVEQGAPDTDVPDQRRASLRAGRAPAWRRARRLVDGRADLGHRRRWRARDRRQGPPGPRRHGRGVRPPDDRSRMGRGARAAIEAASRRSRARTRSPRHAARSTAEEAFDRARAGDERALRGINDVGRYLGIGIANMVVGITPDRVVIGGGIAAAFDLLCPRSRPSCARRVHVTSLDPVEVVAGAAGRLGRGNRCRDPRRGETGRGMSETVRRPARPRRPNRAGRRSSSTTASSRTSIRPRAAPAPTAPYLRPGSSTSTSTAGAATTRWATPPRSTACRARCCATASPRSCRPRLPPRSSDSPSSPTRCARGHRPPRKTAPNLLASTSRDHSWHRLNAGRTTRTFLQAPADVASGQALPSPRELSPDRRSRLSFPGALELIGWLRTTWRVGVGGSFGSNLRRGPVPVIRPGRNRPRTCSMR